MSLKSIVFLSFLSLIVLSCSACKTGRNTSNDDDSVKVTDPKFRLVNKKSVPMGAVKVRVNLISDQNIENNVLDVKIMSVVMRGRQASDVYPDQEIIIKFSDEQKGIVDKIKNNSIVTIRNLASEKGKGEIVKSEPPLWQLISVE